MGVDVTSDTEIYKNTYHQLVCWIKELLAMRRADQTVYDRNIAQAKRIMELEFDLRRFRRIMVEDTQETVMQEYGVAENNVSSLEEYRKAHPRLMRGGGNPPEGEWLSKMEWGTMFFVRRKNQNDWLLVKFLMAGIQAGVVLLVPMQGTEDVVSDDRAWLPVDPAAFCRYWELMSQIPPAPLPDTESIEKEIE